MDLTKKLVMTCTITSIIGQDIGGDPREGPKYTNTKCFVYGNTRRFKDTRGLEYVPDFQMLLFPDTDIKNDYQVDNVMFIEPDGTEVQVLEHGTVVNVQTFRHPIGGTKIIQAYLNKR